MDASKFSPVNLDGKIGKVKNLVYAVGVELEGGWKRIPEGTNLVHDGSVRIDPAVIQVVPETGDEPLSELEAAANQRPPSQPAMNWAMAVEGPRRPPETTLAYSQRVTRRARNYQPNGSRRQQEIQTGEIPSPKLMLDELGPWMRTYYPPYVNASCGLHVHVSFRWAKTYQRLMSPEVVMTTVKYLSEWAEEKKLGAKHPIWDRLSGKNRYCKFEFHADAQARCTRKGHEGAGAHRYTVWNFPHAVHGTAECRILPMMEDPELGIEAVKRVLDITNAFLTVTRKKDEPFEGIIKATGETGRSEMTVIIAPEPFGGTIEIG